MSKTPYKLIAIFILSNTFVFGNLINGFYSSNKSNTTNSNQTSNASNLSGKNIYINTDERLSTNTNVVGSNVIADENLYINTNNLNVKASQDSSSSTQDSKSINGSVSFTIYGGGGGTAGLGYGKSDSSSDSFLNNNSQLSGNNVNINVTNDANFVGANVRANDTLNLNVGNNLVLESLRDEYSSNSKGFNVNAGVGFGSGGKEGHRVPSLDVGKTSSVNSGISMNNGVTQSKQTVLSSIIGDKVNVNVGNNTHLKGSLLASGNYDEKGIFQDNQNLNLTTNTLTFGNLSNSNYSSSKSLGVNVNYNLEDKKVENGQEKPQQKGISSVGYQAENSLSANASKTLATLGQGNVTVKDLESSDELDRLNRDTAAVNKDLYSSTTGTKVDATLDTRLLTEEGREQIAKEVEQLADTVKIIGSYISNYDKILEIRENAQNVNLKITQELDKLREENPQLYKDTIIAIQEYNNALKEQQDINGQLAFAPVAIVIPPLVTELLISAGVITTVVNLTEDNRNNLVGGGINGKEIGMDYKNSRISIPTPEELANDNFLPDLTKVKKKTPVQGGGGLRDRWEDKKGNIYEWDSQHGEMELYDKQGKHKGAYNPKTGETKPPVKGRKVEK